MSRGRLVLVLALLLLLPPLIWVVLGIITPDRPAEQTADERARLASLEAEVERLRSAFGARVEADSAARSLRADSSDLLIGIGTGLLQRALAEGGRTYLDEVRLHVPAGDVVLRERGDVGTDVGPVRIRAGSWDLEIVMRRLEARLSADSVRVSMSDSTRMALVVWARAEEASGEAGLRFAWDAATATSLVCRDFEVEGVFRGTAPARSYRIEGLVDFRASGDRIHAWPRQTGGNLRVAPRPDPASWGRVRALLEDQDRFSRCGLFMSPDDLEAKLRERLAEGFRFRLPDTILEPIPLPAGVRERVAVDGESRTLSVVPVTFRLAPDALWYGVTVSLERPDPEATGAP